MQNADVPPQDRSTGPAPDHGPDVREDLLRFAELGGFTLAADTHAWYAAIDTVTGPEEARAASTVLAEVRGGGLSGAQDAATRLVAGSDLREPATLTEANALIGLGRRLQDTAVTLGSGAYVEDLDALAAATASSAWRKERGLKLSWGRRRKLRSQARLLAVADRPRRDALHAALVAAAAERTDWAALAMSGAASVVRPLDGTQLEATAQSVEALAGALRELGRLLPDHDLTALPFADLADLVDRLAADEGTLYRLSELRTLRASLEAAGLADLLADLTTAHADRTATEAAYRRHTGEAEAAEPAEEVVAAVEAEAAVEPEVEAAVEAEAEIEVEAEAGTEAETAWQALAAGPREALDNEPTPEPEPAPELEPVAVVEPEPEPEPVAEPEPEPVAVAVVEPAPEAAAPAPEAPAPAPAKRSRRPRKPDLTPGRPVTAYTPAELLALVRWIDGDAVERTDDELLRAAMKELGFARMGPRIKDALGAAVTEARL
ncbi:hypothetical protein [Kitasatospora sp. MAA4]|uniref:hypothetical protein n=1 Tax=Kitasatospora sp. MAA4 TaxID=3035093 RepID=UPI002473E7A6|nr:hypothetical protein [Kitasatospora sp. MAA4]